MVRVAVRHRGDAELSEVAQADDSLRRFARLGTHRHEDADQQPDDPDHDEQLDERKPRMRSPLHHELPERRAGPPLSRAEVPQGGVEATRRKSYLTAVPRHTNAPASEPAV